jgi:hypothetical protein
MKIRTWQVIFVISIAALLVAACQSAPTPEISTPETSISSTEAPSTGAEQEDQAYPGPEAQASSAQLSANDPYPSPGEGEQVDWEQAIEMISGGEVTAVFQSLSNQVTLYLRNNQQMVTVQPEVDEVIRVIKACGEPCRLIRIGSE